MRSLVGTLLVTITCIVSVYSLKCIQCENSNGTTCPEKTETTQDCLDSNYQCGVSYLAELRGNEENIRIVKGCKKQEECTEGPAVISNSNVIVAFGVECCGSKNCTVRDTFIDKLLKTSSSKTTNKHTCSSCFSESNEMCQPTEQRSCHGNETRCGRIIIDFGGSKNYLSIRGCANPEFCSQKLVTSNFTSLIKEKDCNLQCTHCENSTGLTCLENTETMMNCPDSEYQCATSYFVERRGEKTMTSWSSKGCNKANECTSPAIISNPNVAVAFGVACCGNNSCPVPDNLFAISKTENNQTCTSCNSNSIDQCQSKDKIKCYGNETKCGRIVIDSQASKNYLSIRGCANPEFCSQKLVNSNFTSLIKERDCSLQCTHCENSAGLTCLEKTETMKDCPDSEYQCATSYFVERRGEKTTKSWSYKGCKKTNECTSLATISNPNASVAFGVACCGNNSCPIPDNLFPISKTENNQTCTSCNSNSLFQCHSKEKIKCYGNETKCGRIVIDSLGAVGEDWSMRGCANQAFCSSELVSPGAKFNIMFSEKHCTDSGSTQKLSVLILTVAVFWTLLF
ncbi:uncharacterized protein LOC143933725 [Lithobates pipiens]